MKNFAGLDLSQLDLNFLSAAELQAIEHAFLENYQKLAGSIDLTQAEAVLAALMRFIKISMVAPGAVDGTLTTADSLTALSIYFLPHLSNQVIIQRAQAQLQQLPNYQDIVLVQQEPFSLTNVALVWDLMKDHKDKFNFTGFTDKSATQLYEAVGFELYTQAYAKLKTLGQMRVNLAQDYAWKYLALQYILHRVHQRLQGRDFRFGLDVADTKREVKKFTAKTYRYMLETLSDIMALPEHPHESAARTMLHRFRSTMQPSTTTPETTEEVAKRSAKVTPL